MPIFRYEAADTTGKVMRGAMDAASPQEVSSRLSAKGYSGVRVLEGSAVSVVVPSPTQQQQQNPALAASLRTAPNAAVVARQTAAPFSFGMPIRPEDLGLFFRQMASLANAGYTPGSALADLGMRTQNGKLKAAAQAMARETAAGGSLAGAMARQTTVFPPHIVGLVQAGETGGFLPFAFEEAALGAEQDAALRQNLWVVKLLTWQSVWSVILAAPLFLNFGRLFSETNGGMAALGHIVRVVLLVAVPIGILLHLLAFGAGWLWRQPSAAGLRDRLTLAVPTMAKLARMRALASFTRVLRRLLLSGISPAPAFVGASQAVPNGILRDRFLEGAAVVGAGGGLDEAIRATGLMGSDPMNLLITGQKTGQWSEMLDQVTAYYQEEAARATEAAKSAQKRWATMTVLLSMGYVTCALTYYGYKAMWKFIDGFSN